MATPVKGVDQSNRRTWDKAAFEQKARERAAREAGDFVDHNPPPKAATLKEMKPVQAREEDLNLTEHVNKTESVQGGSADRSGGFYCETCDCLMKDSLAYLDHINGKKHQRALGTSLRPERAGVDAVRARLASNFEAAKMKRLQEAEEKRKQEEKEARKKEKKDKKAQEKLALMPAADDDAMAAMGFGGFGTTKKK
eukprot:TRINITY_DN1089_c0_g1_i1.p1 TRINITY_DN1089_c0_g1~~TRINITY_DN1089_c0_g1_i1.p1  ORF type:complete len:196 (+),score=72.88 TRINITY_DN1089_c0_g1_i1:55-642(+)